MTYKSRVKRDFSEHEEITPDIIRDLELEAIDKISTDSGKDLSEFYCVGYSPVYYELDGSRINNPVGHRARSVAAEVIVTFLAILEMIRLKDIKAMQDALFGNILIFRARRGEE